ncbi:MAG: hypothetical protein AAF367_12285 [Pseudomonadota bacterium]
MSGLPTLFVVGPSPIAGDPLDPVEAVRTGMSPTWTIGDVRPGHDISYRGLLRRYQPGRDAVLYDLTSGIMSGDMITMMMRRPGVVLRSAVEPRLMPNLPLAAWQRANGIGSEAWPGSFVIALDCAPPRHHMRCPWPNADRAGAQIRVGCTTFGGASAQYGAMLGWRDSGGAGPVLRLVGETVEEVAQMRTLRDRLGLTASVEIRLAPSRLAAAQLARDAARIIDINPMACSGLTAPLVLGRDFARPSLRLDCGLEEIPGRIAAFLSAQPSPAPARHDFTAACMALCEGIETAVRAVHRAARAGRISA